MVAVHVHEIALPLDALTGGRCDDETGLVDDGSGGAVFARNPFGVDEGHRPGLNGDGFGGMQDLAWSVGEIDGECDGRGLSAS